MFAKISLRLFGGLGFLFCLMAISTFGQGLVTYSDTWADTETGLAENPENNELFIVGIAVVEVDPKSDYHSVNTQVTMTSPRGRTATGKGTWTQESEGTSLSVTTSIDVKWEPEPETGNYQSLVIHIPTCPESHPPIGGGGENYPLGVSFVALFLDRCIPGGCYYRRVNPCNVTCNDMIENFVPGTPGHAGACIQGQIPYGPLGCLIFGRVQKNVTACICYDVGWN